MSARRRGRLPALLGGRAGDLLIVWPDDSIVIVPTTRRRSAIARRRCLAIARGNGGRAGELEPLASLTYCRDGRRTGGRVRAPWGEECVFLGWVEAVEPEQF